MTRTRSFLLAASMALALPLPSPWVGPAAAAGGSGHAIAPALLDFGATIVGAGPRILKVTLTSQGPDPLSVTDVTLGEHNGGQDPSIAITRDGCTGAVLPKDATCPVDLTLDVPVGAAPGPRAADLVIRDSATPAGLRLPVTTYAGYGPPSRLELSLPAAGTTGRFVSLGVHAFDEYGNEVNPSPSLTYATDDPDGRFPAGGVTALPATGRVAFCTPGTRSVTVSDASGWLPPRTTSIEVAAGPGDATGLVLSEAPDSVAVGAPTGARVTLVDPCGRVASGYAGEVFLDHSDPDGDLPASHRFTAADAGTHRFEGILFRTPGGHNLFASELYGDLWAARDVDVTAAPAAPGPGYWMVGAAGRVHPFGAAASHGDLAGAIPAGSAAVGVARSATGRGYWLTTDRGEVRAYGDAAEFGGTPPALAGGERVTSISATPDGTGYWLFTDTGRAFAYGSAPFAGDMAGIRLAGPVLGSVSTPTGRGYYMVAADGGIFAFGDAVFRGSMGAARLNAGVVGLAPDPDGAGYWLVAADGGIFAFDAPFLGSTGSLRLNQPVIGMVAYGNGYLLVARDGGIFTFSNQPFVGSLGTAPPADPIVAVAAL